MILTLPHITQATGVLDMTTILDTKISHPNVRMLNKWSSFLSTTCFHYPQLKPSILHLLPLNFSMVAA